jgi:hypothetical protein
MQDEFLDLERRCAAFPRDRACLRRMLQLYFTLGQPDELPGASLPLPDSSPRPRIAVITPYAREALGVLDRCHRSVQEQTLACDHIMAADGFARDEVDDWNVRHIRLDKPSNDFGDTPRRIAGNIARDEGYDAVAYLDADNAFRPRHVESLFELHRQRGSSVCHAARTFHRVDGTLMPLLQEGDNHAHVDTNCLLIMSEAFELLSLWGSWPLELSAIDDRLFWRAIVGRGLRTAFSGALTCKYEASHEAFFRALNEPAPPGTRPDIDLERVFRRFDRLSSAERQKLDAQIGLPVESLIASLRPPTAG